jgi:hypothetical protein
MQVDKTRLLINKVLLSTYRLSSFKARKVRIQTDRSITDDYDDTNPIK